MGAIDVLFDMISISENSVILGDMNISCVKETDRSGWLLSSRQTQETLSRYHKVVYLTSKSGTMLRM